MDLSKRIGRRPQAPGPPRSMSAAKAGAWGKTAQRLNTTRPAVSRTIEELDLEDAIGVRLLDRSRREGSSRPPIVARCSTDTATVFDDLR
jgi:hypothetical protein